MAFYTDAPVISPAEELGGRGYDQFLRATFNHRDTADYRYNKRIFITMCQPVSASSGPYNPPGTSGSAGIAPLRTILSGSYPEETQAIKTNDISELSTAEIVSYDRDEQRFNISKNFNFNQNYVAVQKTGNADHNHTATPGNFISGSYVLSMCNDNNPSLLVELNKEQALPDDIGDNEFVILPANIHPFIKDNLNYFLTKGGINVSGDSTPNIKLDNTHRNLL
jgi:hypothetical protein